MLNNPVLAMGSDASASMPTMQKWGALAFLLLPVTLIAPRLIYLVGDLRSVFGPFGYSLADFLYGPMLALTLVTAVISLRQYLDKQATQRMSLASIAAMLAAATMIGVAMIRATNRAYHLAHPELHLEESAQVLMMWTTLVASVEATGWHFFGWSLILVAAAGWSSHLQPRLLNILYLLGGSAALFIYLLPEMEGFAILSCLVLSLWQGILLWRAWVSKE